MGTAPSAQASYALDVHHSLVSMLYDLPAGNMAHLLNHSCTPNCHSRNLTTCHPDTAQLQEHIIIYALSDLDIGQELTYDYR